MAARGSSTAASSSDTSGGGSGGAASASGSGSSSTSKRPSTAKRARPQTAKPKPNLADKLRAELAAAAKADGDREKQRRLKEAMPSLEQPTHAPVPAPAAASAAEPPVAAPPAATHADSTAEPTPPVQPPDKATYGAQFRSDLAAARVGIITDGSSSGTASRSIAAGGADDCLVGDTPAAAAPTPATPKAAKSDSAAVSSDQKATTPRTTNATTGRVKVRYNHYNHDFEVVGGRLDFRSVDAEYALAFAFKGQWSCALKDGAGRVIQLDGAKLRFGVTMGNTAALSLPPLATCDMP